MSDVPKRLRDQRARMGPALDAVAGLLRRLGRQGLQRASRTSATELQALKQTAHNAGLIRIARQVEALSTYVERYLERDPVFSMADYGGALNRAWLLCGATRRRLETGAYPPEMLDLIGESRRSYVPVDGPLEVQTLGAWGWASDTGFIGITACLWSADGLLEISAARPSMHFGSDPKVLLRTPVLDDGTSMARLAHGAWTFHGAKRSRDGRLSLHRDLEIRGAPYLGARAYADRVAEDWRVLLRRLGEAAADPVVAAPPVLAYVRPRSVGPVTIDDKHAEAWAVLHDARGMPLRLTVPLRRENDLLVDNLAHLGPGLDGIFGRAYVLEGALAFAPLTAVLPRRREPLCHLTLRSGSMADAAERLLADVGEVVEQVLVCGLWHVPRDLAGDLGDLTERARTLGLETGAARLDALREALPSPDGAWVALQALLAWSRVFRRAASLARVEARLGESVAEAAPAGRANGWDGRVVVEGFDLDDAGRLTLQGLELEGGAPVRVVDRLSEYDAADPFRGRVIGRLLQAAVPLRRLVDGVLCFEAHPWTRRGGRVELAPAFREVPVLRDMATRARPEVERFAARLDAAGDWFTPEGDLTMTPTLRLNLTKLHWYAPGAVTQVAVRRGGETLDVLHALDDVGERVFPAQDPRAFRAPDAPEVPDGEPPPDEVTVRALELAETAPEEARGFLLAHLEDLRRPKTPLPSPGALLAFAQALEDHDETPGPGAVERLELGSMRVARTCAAALLRDDPWAWPCLRSAGLAAWFVR